MYKFEKINEDTYKLITDEKEFIFTRTVDLAKELQKVDLYATSYMADMLAARGETFENTTLKVERIEGNKTIVDETNFKKMEEKARNLANYDVISLIFKKIFGKDYLTMLTEAKIDINNLDEVNKFVGDIMQIVVNGMTEKSPRVDN